MDDHYVRVTERSLRQLLNAASSMLTMNEAIRVAAVESDEVLFQALDLADLQLAVTEVEHALGDR